MYELLAIGIAIGCFFGPFLLAAWILRPLDRSARYYKSNGRFMMGDFLGLVFLVQVPIALVTNFNSGSNKAAMTPLYVILPLISALVWWTAVSTFAKVGVKSIRTRMVLVFIVLPIAYFGSLTLIAVPVMFASRGGFQIRLVVIAIFIMVGMIISGLYTRSIERRLKLHEAAR